MKSRSIFFAGLIMFLSSQNFVLKANDFLRIMNINGTESSVMVDDIRNIVFTPDGIMRVEVTGNHLDFPIETVQNIVFSISTDLEEIIPDKKQELLLYPNPVTDFLNIRMEVREEIDVLVQLFDLNGKMMLSQTYRGEELNSGISVNVSLLPKGLYLCRLHTDQQTFSAKFLK